MAEDLKFKFDHGLGQFVNRVSGEAIPHDEPVMLFRARDIHALPTLRAYMLRIGDPHHQQAVRERIIEFTNFQCDNPDRMKEPGTTHHVELHSSRRDPHGSRGTERSQDERLSALEHRDDLLETKMEKAMADIDTLNSILGGIASDAQMLIDDFKNLEAQLQAAQDAANNNQPIDLTSAILAARGAQEALDGLVQSAAAAGVAPAPAPTPSGGDTSGSSDTSSSDTGSSDTSGSGDAGSTDTSGSGDAGSSDSSSSETTSTDTGSSDTSSSAEPSA